jgi:hypothetical protein
MHHGSDLTDGVAGPAIFEILIDRCCRQGLLRGVPYDRFRYSRPVPAGYQALDPMFTCRQGKFLAFGL